jgi:hypothetical protein
MEQSPRASFGAFAPGVGKEYTAQTSATVISTAGDAALSVADPSATATGKLVNGTFALNQPLMAKGVSAAPTKLATWTNPVSHDPVTIGFSQTILPANRCARAPTPRR